MSSEHILTKQNVVPKECLLEIDFMRFSAAWALALTLVFAIGSVLAIYYLVERKGSVFIRKQMLAFKS